MKITVQYHIIASLDITDRDRTITSQKPEFLKKGFMVTETSVEDPEFYKKHRKYVGVVSAEKMREVAEQTIHCWGDTDICDTMGALTLDFGMLPAISWNCRDYYNGDCLNLYVSPVIASEDEVIEAMEQLPEAQREIKLNKIRAYLETVMNTLLEPVEDMDYPETYVIDIEQCELELSI